MRSSDNPIMSDQNDGGDSLDWMTSSSTAVSNLIALHAEAKAAGQTRVAKVSAEAASLVSDFLQPMENPSEEVTESILLELKERLEAVEEAVRESTASEPEALQREFECNRQLRTCLTTAQGMGEKTACWLSFGACLVRSVRGVWSYSGPEES